MLSSEQRHELIEKIRSLPGQVADLVSDLTDEQLTTPYLEGEWTVAQNVHHLADSHLNSYVRMKLMLTEDHPTLKPYDQELWANLVDADQAFIQPSLSILDGLHRRWVRLFESLPETAWHRTGLHPEIGELTIEDLLRIYADHGESHLAQINRALAAQGA